MNLLKVGTFLVLCTAFILASCGSSVELIDTDEFDNQDSAYEVTEITDFSIQTMSGEVFTSASLLGKNYVIYFFGYNCPTCKAVGPEIESRLHQVYKDSDDFAIFGVDQWDGNEAGVQRFKSDTGITFPLGLEGSSMARDFRTTYDRLVIVNKEGQKIYTGKWIAANSIDSVEDMLNELLD